ncbi:MAG: sigma 54-interacting transcriptional regulator, partial [Candidatus Izemoplasmatales bacterium]
MTENQNQFIDTFKFKCEHCQEEHSFEQFQHSIVLTGLIVLVSPSGGYLGILCQECNKVTVNNFSLDQVFEIWEELNDNTSKVHIRANNAIVTDPEQVLSPKTLSYNSYSNYSYKNRNFIYTDDITINSGDSDLVNHLNLQEIITQIKLQPTFFSQVFFDGDEIYCSYYPKSKIDDDKILIYALKKNKINEIVELENQRKKKIFPRYYYPNKLQQKANKYCLKIHDISIFKHLWKNLEPLYIKEKNDLLEKTEFLNLIEEGGRFYDIIKDNKYRIIFPLETKAPKSKTVHKKSEGITPPEKKIKRVLYKIESESLTVNDLTLAGILDGIKDRESYFEDIEPAEFIFTAGSFQTMWKDLLRIIWQQITKEEMQMLLQKKGKDFRLDYSDEACKTNFSFISIVELLNRYVQELNKQIKGTGEKKGREKWIDRKTSSNFSELIKSYNEKYPSLGRIISNDHFVNQIKQNIVDVYSRNNLTVIIFGETGTGKELIARAIHDVGFHEKHFSDSLITVNCGALSKDLLESELFGHVKGAFSGAINDKVGKIEAADKGVLFLDEIGELDINHQAKLLRALEYKTITRVGDNKEKKINFKLVCATNRDLEKEVDSGKFRQDLYFRINSFPIKLPPLRKRNLEDIELLSDYFLKTHNKEYNDNKQLNATSIKNLTSHNWLGNIRELKSVIERSAFLSKNNVIEIDPFPDPKSKSAPPKENAPISLRNLPNDDKNRRYIKAL